mmetsp:Transcript_24599/g.30081  ORF Transcript_24599/g.30081 Transcript_24599/m.30081 type:complete len:303 (+) Transcript_24599:284-1192(+)
MKRGRGSSAESGASSRGSRESRKRLRSASAQNDTEEKEHLQGKRLWESDHNSNHRENGSEDADRQESECLPIVKKVFEFVRKLAVNPNSKLENFNVERAELMQFRDYLYVGPENRKKKREYSNTRSREQTALNRDRPSSPTLFLTEQDLEQSIEATKRQSNSGDKKDPCADLNRFLGAVRQRFYLKNFPYNSQMSLTLNPIRVPSEPRDKDEKVKSFRCVQRHSTLGSLVSPINVVRIEDNWSPREVSLFESGLCTYGKQFHIIQRLLNNKTTKEVVEFYYVWKKSENYSIWKKSQQNKFGD